jgi:hypothetical protein
LPHDAGQWLGSHQLLYAIAQFGPVLVVSYVVYRAVELPSLRWIERFSVRTREQKHASVS